MTAQSPDVSSELTLAGGLAGESRSNDFSASVKCLVSEHSAG